MTVFIRNKIISHNVMHAAFDERRRVMLRHFLTRLGEATSVVEDTERDGIYQTAWRAWGAYDPCASWHIVFQDDMWATPSALDTIRAVLKNDAPSNSIVSFFQPAIGAARVILEHVAPWLDGGPQLLRSGSPDVMWGGTIAVPTRLIPSMLSWIKTFMPEKLFSKADDEKICFWAWKERLQCLTYTPCLFEHAGWTNSVTDGVTHSLWKRGVAIAGEAEHRRGLLESYRRSVAVELLDDGRVKLRYDPSTHEGEPLVSDDGVQEYAALETRWFPEGMGT